jgi:hypothetical protein
MQEGNGYFGSSALETSVANAELIPTKPADWTQGYSVKKLSFMNNSDCTLIINGGDPIFIRGYQGFSTDYNDKYITSLKIGENGVVYNIVCAY